MDSNYKKHSPSIEEIVIDNPDTPQELRWLNIINAGKSEIDYLKNRFHFNIDHLKASIATVFSQRPMISKEDGYLFIILHFPITVNGKITAGEIEFFLGHGYLTTVHNNNVTGLKNFWNLSRRHPERLLTYANESSVMLLYELLNSLIKECYALIDRNNIEINRIEEAIFSNRQKEAVSQILTLRMNIINIRRILVNHSDIMKKLTNLKSSLIPQEAIKSQYVKLVNHSERIWQMLDNQKEMIEILNSTNESLLNGQMTNVMKTLTIISVIVFPLNLIAAIFAMRTDGMPLVDNPFSFWMVLTLMAFFSMIMLWFFERRKWL
jgi:magnesium transporter